MNIINYQLNSERQKTDNLDKHHEARLKSRKRS